MKRQYTKPEAKSVLFPEPLMDNKLVMTVSEKFTSEEASRESKFGFDEQEGEETETFWDE